MVTFLSSVHKQISSTIKIFLFMKPEKITFSLLLALATLVALSVFTSCGDDDDDPLLEDVNNGNGGSSSNTSGGTTGGSSGSSTKYEKPDVTFDDYFPNYTSMKVSYKVWNGSKAKLTKVRAYYGTTSNPTRVAYATYTNSVIYGNLSGLKAGTTYYVKCVATGPGGTTTTPVTKCRTISH